MVSENSMIVVSSLTYFSFLIVYFLFLVYFIGAGCLLLAANFNLPVASRQLHFSASPSSYFVWYCKSLAGGLFFDLFLISYCLFFIPCYSRSIGCNDYRFQKVENWLLVIQYWIFSKLLSELSLCYHQGSWVCFINPRLKPWGYSFVTVLPKLEKNSLTVKGIIVYHSIC
jgi:hypothetical protein